MEEKKLEKSTGPTRALPLLFVRVMAVLTAPRTVPGPTAIMVSGGVKPPAWLKLMSAKFCTRLTAGRKRSSSCSRRGRNRDDSGAAEPACPPRGRTSEKANRPEEPCLVGWNMRHFSLRGTFGKDDSERWGDPNEVCDARGHSRILRVVVATG